MRKCCRNPEPKPCQFARSRPPAGLQVYGALKTSAKKAKGGAKLGTLEAAVLGSGASLVAQAVTTPLDVVRTRVMTASPDDQEYEGVPRLPMSLFEYTHTVLVFAGFLGV